LQLGPQCAASLFVL
jgi:hypothetical protein